MSQYRTGTISTTDESTTITHSKFFGFGPAILFAQVDEAVIISNAFLLGPFVIMKKPPNQEFFNFQTFI